MIISLLNQKGGVGKTTLAVNIADNLYISKSKVLLIDADPQGSALDWASIRSYDDIFPVIGLPKPTLHKEVKSFSRDYSFIIIDGPPRSYDVTRSVLMASNIVIIPVQPSPYDVWATDEIIKLIKESKVFNENMKCAFVVNRKIANTAIGRDVNEAFESIEVPILKSQICQRIIYAETAAKGSTVCRQNQHNIAAQEIIKLTQEIIQL